MLVLLIFICAAVLAMSFLCSLTETVPISLNPLALKRMSECKTRMKLLLAQWDINAKPSCV